MSEYSVNQGRKANNMKPEQVELWTAGREPKTQEMLPNQALPPKVLQQTPRRPRAIITTLFILFGLGLVVAPIIIPLMAVATVAGRIPTPCPRQAAFSIDYPFGTLSYNAVKVIGAMWNLAVGRGVQLFAAWICYKIFGMAMLRITQQNQVSLELYSAIAFYPLDIKTIPMVLQAIVSKCGWRGRMTFIWFLAAIVYVLILPTILDLMTGYVANSTAMVPSSSGGGHVPVSLQDPSSQYYIESTGCKYGTTGVTCVPSNTSQWGFSSTFVLVVLSVTAVWCWGRNDRRSGLYRDILDVSNTLQEALGPDTCAYGNAELTKEVEKMGSVGFEAVSNGSTGYIALRHEPVGCASLRNHDVEYGRRTK
jgi:hypothetical protein